MYVCMCACMYVCIIVFQGVCVCAGWTRVGRGGTRSSDSSKMSLFLSCF